MDKKLVKRSEFARLAGVAAPSVTKACSKQLAAACVGRRIDLNHPDAVEYLRKHDEATPPKLETGIDSRYEEAIAYCRETGVYTQTHIQRGLGLSYDRARSILNMMKVAGLVPGKRVPPPEPPAVAPASRVIAGTEKARQTKKSEALENLITGRTLHEVPEDIETFADMTLRELIQRFGTDVAFKDWLDATKSIEAINGARIKNAAAEGKLISRELVRKGVIDVFNSAFLRLMTDGAKTIATEVAMKIQAGAEPGELEAHVSEVLGSFIKPVKAKAARVLKNA